MLKITVEPSVAFLPPCVTTPNHFQIYVKSLYCVKDSE